MVGWGNLAQVERHLHVFHDPVANAGVGCVAHRLFLGMDRTSLALNQAAILGRPEDFTACHNSVRTVSPGWRATASTRHVWDSSPTNTAAVATFFDQSGRY